MRHIFGIVVREFSVATENAAKLEMDYLAMVRISNELSAQGDIAVFYMVIMNNNMVREFERLSKRFEDQGQVEMIFVSPDQQDFIKHMPILGKDPMDLGGLLVLATQGPEEISADKVEAFALAVGNDTLLRHVQRREKAFSQIKERYLMPAGLDFDFYAVV
ncbi:MAG: hypothetical protein AAF502_03560 [Bacteroidota bacterium]